MRSVVPALVFAFLTDACADVVIPAEEQAASAGQSAAAAADAFISVFEERAEAGPSSWLNSRTPVSRSSRPRPSILWTCSTRSTTVAGRKQRRHLSPPLPPASVIRSLRSHAGPVRWLPRRLRLRQLRSDRWGLLRSRVRRAGVAPGGTGVAGQRLPHPHRSGSRLGGAGFDSGRCRSWIPDRDPHLGETHRVFVSAGASSGEIVVLTVHAPISEWADTAPVVLDLLQGLSIG